MPTYLSPGVYVEEVASGSAPIAGVGTSTAGFIGIITAKPQQAVGSNSSQGEKTENIDGKANTKNYVLNAPDGTTQGTVVKVTVNNSQVDGATIKSASGKLQLTLPEASKADDKITVEYTYAPAANPPVAQPSSTYSLPTMTVEGEVVSAKADQTTYVLAAPAGAVPGEVKKVTVNRSEVANASIAAANGKLQLTLPGASAANDQIRVNYTYIPASVPNLNVTLCTNFAEFKKSFGDFPIAAEETASPGRRTLTHAVYGFFNNGGTRCYVVWINGTGELDKALGQFEAIDEIAIVAVPGETDADTKGKVDVHCRQATQDRVAIFDAPESPASLEDLKPGGNGLPGRSNYAALYYPWLQVYDPAVKGTVNVPPSGHIAGIYARVDSQRGVYKAPANEPIFGALGVTDSISKRKQDGLNPQGVNCIRELNGSIQVWGARTWGGDDNGEFKYISTRRLFNYLRESIDEGTQWTVFEPNSPELWAKIRRSVTAFLTMVWRTGALFGATPEQAFFVKCDEETNPPEVREQGQVVTIIGVAVVKPAEFVIFRISQWAGPGES